MASFATEVKNELAHLRGQDLCCSRAELTALLRLGGSLYRAAPALWGLSFANRNAAVVRKVLILSKKISPSLSLEISVSRSDRLRSGNSYILKSVPSHETDELLDNLGLLSEGRLNLDTDGDAVRRACCRAAYLRGAFLGGGSVNKPEAACHLELVAENPVLAEFMRDLMRRFRLPAKLTERKDNFVVYLKDGEAILDFLALIRAAHAVEQYEVGRNLKEVRSQVNRIVNCETANLAKSVDAASRQVADIRRCMDSEIWATMSDTMKETAAMRLAHTEAGLTELAELLCVSKSGLNHRFRKFRALAKELGDE